MSELKRISPLLDKLIVGESISEHNGVCCYPAITEADNQKYILKVITEPSSPAKLEALLLTGAYPDVQSAMKYFGELADDIISEAETLQKLSKIEGFTSYEAWQKEVRDTGDGIDVYLLSPYRATLLRQIQRNTLTHLNAINLGIDLSSALSACRRCGFLYVNLKPGNVFLAENGQYLLGDLGFMNLSSLKYASLPEKYRSAYTAPEVADAFSCVSTTADVYALGLMLYQVYNGGALPFTGDTAPAQVFDPPVYADYEMAEIIAKACAPDPQNRWQTPAELGQALISYMQRNGANDTPIIPPAIEVEEAVAEDAQLEEPPVEDGAADEEAAPIVLADSITEIADDEALDTDAENTEFIVEDTEDETAPGADDANVDYSEVSGEVSEILEQVDELLSHDAPPPVVAPDPIDVPIPPPLYVSGEDNEDESLEADDETAPNEETADEIIAAAALILEDETTEACTDEAVDETEETCEDEYEDSLEEDEDAQAPKKRSVGKLILRISAIIVLLALLIVGGIHLYQNVYLQEIDKLEITGSRDSLQVIITTDVPDEKLTVVCSDLYGNQLPSPVVDGVATFSELTADKSYTVTVLIDGFHQLIGQTTAKYQSPALTELSSLTATTGATDCSVQLSFDLTGPDSANWIVTYSAADEEEKSLQFTGHIVTINDLTLDKEYTFRVQPEDELYLIGETETAFVARNCVLAENLIITSCVDGQLSAQWSAPADVTVASWIVRYIGNDGSQGSQTVTEPQVTFTDLDTSLGYTVEVIAEYMSVGVRDTVMAGAITITDLAVQHTGNDLVITWNSSAQISQDGWIIIYTIDESETEFTLQAVENTATIANAVPKASYSIRIEAADGTQILSGKTQFAVAKPGNFQNYGTASKYMTFSMCKTPNKKNWTRTDLTSSSYTTKFKVGAKASFLVRVRGVYGISTKNVDVLYVIRGADGSFYSANTQTFRWSDMWSKGYGEFDIPALPGAAGSYNITVYFDGAYVSDTNFTITD